ncbi:MAG: DUF1361 domain-containing protein [Saprospiraceae bacterium]
MPTMPTTPSFFRDRQQARLFGMLVLASTCCGLLVTVRLAWKWQSLPEAHTWSAFVEARGATYLFLIWNLFLAWIPYLAALRVDQLQRHAAGWFPQGLGLLVWSAFLPNAPYIVTDFVHFRPLAPIPLWFDLVLLFASASTGLLLGLLSLRETHGALRRWFSASATWLLIVLAMGLAGFGVWLGRFQRWNSWDLLTRPRALLHDIVGTLSERHELLHALGISALLSGILLVGYGILSTLLERPSAT